MEVVKMGSLSVWHWLIVLAVVVMVFGTKKLGSAGKDLGAAVKGFKEGVNGTNSDTMLPKEVSTPPIDVASRDKR